MSEPAPQPNEQAALEVQIEQLKAQLRYTAALQDRQRLIDLLYDAGLRLARCTTSAHTPFAVRQTTDTPPG